MDGRRTDVEKANEKVVLVVLGVIVAVIVIGFVVLFALVAWVAHDAGCYQPSGC